MVDDAKRKQRAEAVRVRISHALYGEGNDPGHSLPEVADALIAVAQAAIKERPIREAVAGLETRVEGLLARYHEALTDIANERGVCSQCGKLAEGGSVGCVEASRRCTWAPRDPVAVAKAAIAGESNGPPQG